MNWVLLTLLSAFLLGSSDTVAKHFLRDYEQQEMAIVYAVPVALFLLPLLLLQPWPALPGAFWIWVVVLLPFEIAALVLYLSAIRDSPLALTVPYLAFTPVFTVMTSYVLLGETVSAQGFLGILLVVIGAWLLNADQRHTGGWLAPFAAIFREPGSRRMFAAAMIYSLTSTMGKGALQYVPPQFFGPFYFALLGTLTPIVFCARRPQRIAALWRRPAAHLLLGALGAGMVYTHFLALAQAPVAYMIAVKRTSLLFGIVYGALVFGEARLRQNLLAGALMVCGVALVVL